MDAVVFLIPPPTMQQLRNGILEAQAQLHREGMTAVKDADIHEQIWDAYASLLKEGKLNEHVCVLWHAGTTMESASETLKTLQSLPKVPQSLGDGRLLSCGAKLYMDGSGGARTAWLYQDWNKNLTETDTGNHGYPRLIRTPIARKFSSSTMPATTSAHMPSGIVPSTGLSTLTLRHWRKSPPPVSVTASSTPTFQQTTPLPRWPPCRRNMTRRIRNHKRPSRGGSAIRMQAISVHSARSASIPFPPIFISTYSGPAAQTISSLRFRRASAPGPLSHGSRCRVSTATFPSGLTSLSTCTSLFARTPDGQRASCSSTNAQDPSKAGKDADIAVWDEEMYSIPTDKLKDLHCAMTLFQGSIVFSSGTIAEPAGRSTSGSLHWG